MSDVENNVAMSTLARGLDLHVLPLKAESPLNKRPTHLNKRPLRVLFFKKKHIKYHGHNRKISYVSCSVPLPRGRGSLSAPAVQVAWHHSHAQLLTMDTGQKWPKWTALLVGMVATVLDPSRQWITAGTLGRMGVPNIFLFSWVNFFVNLYKSIFFNPSNTFLQ